MGFVYKLTFPNGKAYIGVTTGSVAKRIARHRYVAKHQPQKTFSLYRAWRKHGEPISSILLECQNSLLADEEIRLIGEHQTLRPNGYNAAPGGSINTHDEFAREKMSRARIGMKFSDEHRQNLSLAHKGKPSPKKGKPISTEQRAKLKEAWKSRRLRFRRVSTFDRKAYMAEYNRRRRAGTLDEMVGRTAMPERHRECIKAGWAKRIARFDGTDAPI